MEFTYQSILDVIRGYEYRYNTGKLEYDEAIRLSKDFLRAINPKKLVAIAEQSFDEPQTKQNPKTLEGIEQAASFLHDDVSYGEDNYFIAPENLEWMLLLCHESDLHIYGPKEIVDKFKNITNQ